MSTLPHAEQVSGTAAGEEARKGLKQASHTNGLFEGGSMLLLASVFGNGVNYLFMMFLARQLGMEDFGVYALGVTLFNTLILLVTTGFDSGTVKFTSERLALGDGPAARRMVVAAWSIAACLGILASIALAVMATPLASGVYGKPGLSSLLLLFAAAIPFAFTTVLLLSSIQAYQTVRYTVLVKYLWEPLGKWSIVGLALIAGWGLAGVVGGLAVTFMASAVFAGVALVRVARLSIHDVSSIQRDDVRVLSGYCFPLLAANIFGVVAPRMDIMMLGYWASSQDVGLYLVAFQTAAVLALVLGAFDVAFAPIMSQAWARKDDLTFRECYATVHRMVAMATVPLFVGVVVFRDEILSLFGREIGEGGIALAILALGYLVNAMTGGASTVLLMTGRSRTVLMNTVIYGIALVVGTALLIPRWGILGAAISASCALIGVNILRVWQVWQRHAMLPWTWKTLKPLAAGLAMGLVLWVVKPYVGSAWSIPLAGIGALAYLVVLYAARLEADDHVIVAATLARLRPAGN
jgi:O-antigen/teichoic acid export membrane protein